MGCECKQAAGSSSRRAPCPTGDGSQGRPTSQTNPRKSCANKNGLLVLSRSGAAAGGIRRHPPSPRRSPARALLRPSPTRPIQGGIRGPCQAAVPPPNRLFFPRLAAPTISTRLQRVVSSARRAAPLGSWSPFHCPLQGCKGRLCKAQPRVLPPGSLRMDFVESTRSPSTPTPESASPRWNGGAGRWPSSSTKT